MFQKRKEMEAFSQMLDKLINGEELGVSIEYMDSLSSKIQYQLLRLSEKIQDREYKLTRERNEIREQIAEIAHQMRNPLANIESYLELLSGAASDAERQECLEALRNSESQLHFLTESFIKMARLENRIIQIKPNAGLLSSTIMQSILQVKKAADAKHIRIDLEMDEDLKVLHDANWLGEAVYNILDNSVKYSPYNSEIGVSVAQDELYTRILVSDGGIGIAEGEEGQIFRKFYRGKETDGQPGFGLGLYLSREIVLMHGGFLKARRKNPGLEILIFLP
ncbi:MAG: HAMP domain-containing histidine kinase [Lachnospiraceae bacterium]|nr:HAMP domain-containing histidine kinase [Lachnospiraceae bacterium]